MVSLVGLRGQHTNIAASSDSGRIICNRRTVFVSVSLSLGGQTDNFYHNAPLYSLSTRGQTDNLLRFYHNAPPDSNISSFSNVKTSQLCTHRYQIHQQDLKPNVENMKILKWPIFWHKSALQASMAQNKSKKAKYKYNRIPLQATRIYTNIDRGEETAVTEERTIS